jgi:hypothetical protein
MTEKQKFDKAMKKILSVSKEELNRRIKAEKRKPKTRASRVPAAS